MEDKNKTLPAKGLPFSEAVRAGGLLFISGQIGVDPATGLLVDGSFELQAVQVMKNLGQVLEREGLQYSDLVNVAIYLTDMGDYAVTNEVYERSFTDTFPTRICVAVRALAMGAAIEISGVARLAS